MTPKDSAQYFSEHPKSALDVKKIVTSIRNHMLTFQTASGMFSTDQIDLGTRVLIDNLLIPKTGPILDLGAGYGPIAIWLYKELSHQLITRDSSKIIPQIFASEINDRAVWLLKRNIVGNECKEIQILKGDFNSHLESLISKSLKFHAIFSNPPLKMGHETVLELFRSALKCLSPDGFLEYVHKKSLGAEGFMKKLELLYPGWIIHVKKKQHGYYVILLSQHIPDELEDGISL